MLLHQTKLSNKVLQIEKYKKQKLEHLLDMGKHQGVIFLL